MAGVDKVVLTNMGALSSKYGDRVAEIQQALGDLVLADGQRGLATQVVALDDPVEMAALNAHAVKQADDPVQVKVAIDEVFSALRPAYLMILGAIDIVPHQPLPNPRFSSADSNPIAFSDLPYACDAPYSMRIASFVGPTRVVGRLPDVTGSSDPRYLKGLLHTAISGEAQPVPDGKHCLAISTRSFRHLTARVLANLFKSPPTLHVSPSEGPDWTLQRLRDSPVHFINCHGGPSDCRFYGAASEKQDDDTLPIAHDSGCIANRLATGTVVATEACYGAQLYDPAGCGGVIGICNTCLASGAYAFFGSSTIAYGGAIVHRTGRDDPTCPNDQADLLCQYFLRHVLAGSSVGAAALRARHDFVKEMAKTQDPLDPVSLKTLAQFSLMGDPSLHPFLPRRARAAGASARAAGEAPDSKRAAAERARRRARSAATGEGLQRSTIVAHHPIHAPDAQTTITQILRLANATGWGRPELRSFVVSAAGSTQAEAPAPTGPSLVHVVTWHGKRRQAPAPVIELIIATEVDGKITSFRQVSSR